MALTYNSGPLLGSQYRGIQVVYSNPDITLSLKPAMLHCLEHLAAVVQWHLTAAQDKFKLTH